MNKTCANCGAPLAEGVKFCIKCGTPVPVEASSPSFCPNCGEKVQAGAQFCSKCGTVLSRNLARTIPQNQIPIIMQDDTDLPAPQTGWFGFKGRMNREPFIWGSVLFFVLTFVGWFLIDTGNSFAIFLSLCISIPAAISSFSMNIRRLHDLNYDGMFALLFFVPLVNIGMWMYLAFSKGTHGANKYGLDPLTFYKKVYLCPQCNTVLSSKNSSCPKCGWKNDARSRNVS